MVKYAEGEGETWGFTCVKRYSYLFTAFALGGWTNETCSRLMKQLRERVRAPSLEEHLAIYSDGKDSYQTTLLEYFDCGLVDYGKLAKIRLKGRVVDKIREVVFGQPFINRIHTNNVENYNGILRGFIGYLVRKTTGIAKKITQLNSRLHLFQFYWNFLHEIANRGTPAMQEGLSKKKWTWSNLFHYKIKLR